MNYTEHITGIEVVHNYVWLVGEVEPWPLALKSDGKVYVPTDEAGRRFGGRDVVEDEMHNHRVKGVCARASTLRRLGWPVDTGVETVFFVPCQEVEMLLRMSTAPAIESVEPGEPLVRTVTPKWFSVCRTKIRKEERAARLKQERDMMERVDRAARKRWAEEDEWKKNVEKRAKEEAQKKRMKTGAEGDKPEKL